MLSRRSPLVALVMMSWAAGLVAVPSAAALGDSGDRPTHYAMTASANVGRVQLFQTPPPPESGSVGARVVCANRIGQRDTASADSVDLLNVTVHDAASVAWTTRADGKTAASSRSTIGSVDVDDPSIGTVTVTGISSLTQVWHGRHGFHRATRASLGSIVFHPLSGDDVTYPVPQPGHSVTIEDSIRVGVGLPKARSTEHSRWAELSAVSVRMLNQTFTKFSLGFSHAQIQGGVGKQLYGGIALPSLGHDASGPLDSARADVWTVPCVGSGGKLSGFTVIRTTLSDSARSKSVGAYQRSGPDRRGRPSVHVMTAIQRVVIDGGLVIRGVDGSARAVWSERQGYTLSSGGTSVRRVLLNGERVRMHGGDPVNVGGIAILKPYIVKRSKGSIEVIPMRVTMLDGSGQVFDLGYARATLRPSGL